MKLTPLQSKIIMLLVREYELSRKEICNFLNKPRTTIYDNLLILQKLNFVEKFQEWNYKAKVGRPIIKWKIKGKNKVDKLNEVIRIHKLYENKFN